MKKLFIIAMCLVSLGLASCNKEKENEKFIGNYAGTISGDVVMTTPLMEEPFVLEDQGFDVSLLLTAGGQDDEVVASVDLDGEIFSVKGLCNGTHVDFDPFSQNVAVEGQDMNFLVNLKGDLNGNNLDVAGNVKAEGSITLEDFPIPIPVVVTADMTGTLIKQ